MGGRQLEPHEADALIKDREIGPLDGFRSKMGRPFSAKLKLNDANEVDVRLRQPTAAPRTARRRTSPAQTPLGACPKCASRVFELPQRLRVRKGRRPGQDLRLPLRPHDPAAPGRARADGKAARDEEDRPAAVRVGAHAAAVLGVSSSCRRTARSASSSRPRTRPRRARAARGRRTALRVLGAHPKDQGSRSSCTAASYGPYVKHGAVNATLPDRDKVDTLTLDDALEIARREGRESRQAARPSAPRSAAGEEGGKPKRRRRRPGGRQAPDGQGIGAQACGEETRGQSRPPKKPAAKKR